MYGEFDLNVHSTRPETGALLLGIGYKTKSDKLIGGIRQPWRLSKNTLSRCLEPLLLCKYFQTGVSCCVTQDRRFMQT